MVFGHEPLRVDGNVMRERGQPVLKAVNSLRLSTKKTARTRALAQETTEAGGLA